MSACIQIYILVYRIRAYRLDVACEVLNERSSAGWNDLEGFLYIHIQKAQIAISHAKKFTIGRYTWEKHKYIFRRR